MVDCSPCRKLPYWPKISRKCVSGSHRTPIFTAKRRETLISSEANMCHMDCRSPLPYGDVSVKEAKRPNRRSARESFVAKPVKLSVPLEAISDRLLICEREICAPSRKE